MNGTKIKIEISKLSRYIATFNNKYNDKEICKTTRCVISISG